MGLVCPRCKIPLIEEGKKLGCENCGLECVLDNGIHDFIGNHGSYWGEISHEEMEDVLESARTEGWRTAARKVGVQYPDMAEYILSNARIDWLFHCLDLSKTGSCLDIGSGWGSVTFGLARYYDEVWSLEAVEQRIEFQKIRQQQDNITNVKFVRSDWLRLPFPDNYFDIVVANGVLEWVGLSDYSRNPRQVQEDFLKETERVLKRHGCLYLGIENRFALQSLFGAKDHSGLRFTSVLPRKLANLAVKLFRKTSGEYRRDNRMSEEWASYRTYTYSLWGYRGILLEGGFNPIDIYWTLSYNIPKYAGSFGDESFKSLSQLLGKNIVGGRTFSSLLTSLGSHLPKTVIRPAFLAICPYCVVLAYKVGSCLPNKVIRLALSLVCPCFLIFAYKGGKEPSFESKLLQSQGSATGFVRMSGSHGTSSKIGYFFLRHGKLCSVLKFPRFREAAALIGLEEAKMSEFNNLDIKRRVIDGVTVFVEPPIRGIQPQPYNLSHNLKILMWLVGFQRKTQRGYCDFSRLSAMVTTLTDFLSEIHIDDGVRARTRQRMELFLESLRGVKLPQNAEHGDFCISNMLVGDDDQVYVTDWELYEENGEPLFDFVFFLLHNSVRGVMPKSFQDVFRGRGKYSPILRILVPEFARARELDAELILPAVPYTILRCLYRATSGTDNKHVEDIAFYLHLLEAWDKVCLDT